MNRYENNYFKVFFDNYSAQERDRLVCTSIKRGMMQEIVCGNSEIGTSDDTTRDF